jgi:hypothetical protein
MAMPFLLLLPQLLLVYGEDDRAVLSDRPAIEPNQQLEILPDIRPILLTNQVFVGQRLQPNKPFTQPILSDTLKRWDQVADLVLVNERHYVMLAMAELPPPENAAVQRVWSCVAISCAIRKNAVDRGPSLVRFLQVFLIPSRLYFLNDSQQLSFVSCT